MLSKTTILSDIVILTERSVGTFRSTPEASALAVKPKGLKSRISRWNFMLPFSSAALAENL